MLGREPEHFLNRATQALNRPIQSRCAELTVLFDRGSMKDLHTIFPILIDSIFGPHGTICWDLRAITSAVNSQDFQALQHFLSPLGPMFKLIYTLLRDPLVKFEFSLNYLPSKVRQNTDTSTTHPFYTDLIHIDPQTNRTISLMLNPFDYYFFHFAYHLINPFHQRFSSPAGSTWSTVYYILCCDYVLHFLPTNPSCPVLPLLKSYNGKNPTYLLPSFNKPAKSSRLLRSDVLNTGGMQTLEHHPRNEIWRSETIMTVFIDMWLNNDQVLSGSQGFDRSFDMSHPTYKCHFGAPCRLPPMQRPTRPIPSYGPDPNSQTSPRSFAFGRSFVLGYKNFTEKYQSAKLQNVGVREGIRDQENRIRVLESAMHALKEQASYFKSKSKENKRLEEDVAKLQQKLKDMENVQLVITGSREQVNDMLRHNRDPQSLTILVSTLKKELIDSDRKKRQIQSMLKDVQNESHNYKKEVAMLSKEKFRLQQEVESHKNCETEWQYLKKKIHELREVQSQTKNQSQGKANTSIERIIVESPAPLSRQLSRVKDTSTTNISPSVPETVQSIKDSESPYLRVQSSSPKLQMNDIPTGEYIRIVRVLVKQLHSFASSAKADDTHMGELKKIVIPYLQGRIYVFLRHLVHRWPLDGSFRLLLELWLSFLQPWRYPGNEYMKPINQPEVNLDLEDISTAPMKAVDREYMQFMAENLLAYTVILQQLLPRFIRVDLSSPKIALILYRLTKVFGQPNLITYLREIESNAEFAKSSPGHSYNISSLSGLPPLSPTSAWSTNTTPNYSMPYHNNIENSSNLNSSNIYETRYRGGKWASIIKQKILEFEGPNFCYKPIFCASAASEVLELMWHIKKAEETALRTIQLRQDEIRQEPQGFIGFFKLIFIMSDSSHDEFSLEERQKVPTYLQNSLRNLSQIFGVTEPNYTQQQLQDDSKPSTSFQNDINTWLTPQRVRERVKNIKFEGDPELHPIRSDEVKVLVRLLYQLSLKINEDFGPQIRNLYYMESFTGRLLRQVLLPPMTIYKYNKSIPGASPRVPIKLPPRLSLRYFASQKFLFYIILAIVISKMCGYGYFMPIYIVVTIWFLYICLKAICDNRPGNFVAPVDQMDVDYSANESF